MTYICYAEWTDFVAEHTEAQNMQEVLFIYSVKLIYMGWDMYADK